MHGPLLLIAAGVLWSTLGVAMSFSARQGVSAVVINCLSLLSALVLSLLWLPDYGALWMSQPLPRFGELVFLQTLSGILNATGLLAMREGMRHGHNGAVWTISQACLIWPFLFAVFAYGEAVPALRLLGLAAVLVSVTLAGLSRTPKGARGRSRHAWLGYSLSAFVLFGLQSTMQSIPSHWPGWEDVSGLRLPLHFLGGASVYLLIVAMRGIRLTKISLVIGLLLGLGNQFSMVLLYEGMDRMAAVGAVGLTFPITVGTCIVAFTVYSVVRLKEPVHFNHVAATVAGVAGIAFLVR